MNFELLVKSGGLVLVGADGPANPQLGGNKTYFVKKGADYELVDTYSYRFDSYLETCENAYNSLPAYSLTNTTDWSGGGYFMNEDDPSTIQVEVFERIEIR